MLRSWADTKQWISTQKNSKTSPILLCASIKLEVDATTDGLGTVRGKLWEHSVNMQMSKLIWAHLKILLNNLLFAPEEDVSWTRGVWPCLFHELGFVQYSIFHRTAHTGGSLLPLSWLHRFHGAGQVWFGFPLCAIRGQRSEELYFLLSYCSFKPTSSRYYYLNMTYSGLRVIWLKASCEFMTDAKFILPDL